VRLAKGVAAANEGNCLDIVHAHLTKGVADVGHRLLRHGFTKDALWLVQEDMGGVGGVGLGKGGVRMEAGAWQGGKCAWAMGTRTLQTELAVQRAGTCAGGCTEPAKAKGRQERVPSPPFPAPPTWVDIDEAHRGLPQRVLAVAVARGARRDRALLRRGAELEAVGAVGVVDAAEAKGDLGAAHGLNGGVAWGPARGRGWGGVGGRLAAC
jgi:hypothetical protein